ncbi:MAG: LCCL domain-containing protein [Sphaerochaeta sp.]|nr:LCCL domain-containing protein [Sphaerochaeta sp.]
MKHTHTPYKVMIVTILLLVVLATGCTTSLGLGFGFGSGGSSLALGVSTTLPREERLDMWAMKGFALPDEVGEQVSLIFPSGGSAEGGVWGTGIYAEKSTIGMAAVHSGLITFEDGGVVTVQRSERAQPFVGTIRNGIESLSWDKSSEAFSFVMKKD